MESEDKLLSQMNYFKIKPNIDFCNFLIRRRLYKDRNDIKNADVAIFLNFKQKY